MTVTQGSAQEAVKVVVVVVVLVLVVVVAVDHAQHSIFTKEGGRRQKFPCEAEVSVG